MRSQSLCLSGALALLLCQCQSGPPGAQFSSTDRIEIRFEQPTDAGTLAQSLVNPTLAAALDLGNTETRPDVSEKLIEDDGVDALIAEFASNGFFDKASASYVPGSTSYLSVVVNDRPQIWSFGMHNLPDAEPFSACRTQFLTAFNSIMSLRVSTGANDVLDEHRRIQQRNEQLRRARRSERPRWHRRRDHPGPRRQPAPPGKSPACRYRPATVLHTCDRALEAETFAAVYIATDDDEVAAAATSAGVAVVRTSDRPRTGSERCAEALETIDAEIVVDVQGDWPEVGSRDLDRLVECLRESPVPAATLAAPLDEDRATDPNVVKVVRDLAGDALYFSRAPIPYHRAGDGPRLRHIGVYAFRREFLVEIPGLPSSGLDTAEGLEQLRFLENGYSMRVLDASNDPWGIESRADYDAFVGRQPTRTDS